MADKLYCGDDYHQHFNPASYFDTYYSDPDGHPDERGLVPFMYESLHRVFSKEGVSGDRMIDIGTGPCVYSFISACTKFKEIIASDYSEANRTAVKQWINNEPGSFNWKPIIKRVCNLEGHSDIEEREQKMRETIKDVIYCDVHQSNPIGNGYHDNPFDCVITLCCLECACTTHDEYIRCLKNVTSLLKSGGTFFQFIQPLSFYKVEGKAFAGLVADESFIKSASAQADLTNLEFDVWKSPWEPGKTLDFEFGMTIVGTKI
ncbi:indolethylamine N-methyltransferase-like [Glandiceps talaboti]